MMGWRGFITILAVFSAGISGGGACGGTAHAAPPLSVEADGTLISAEGVALRLAHIRFPAGVGVAYEALQRDAVSALARFMAEGDGLVRELGQDRWQRPLVTVESGAMTVQEALLRQGLAVVDARAGLDDERDLDLAVLYMAEEAARREGRGLWAAGLRVHDAAQAMPDAGFGIVEGRIVEVAKVGGRIYVNFGADYRTDFTILLEGDVSRAMQRADPPVTDMAGYTVRVRGMLEEWNGPLLRLAGPQDMEVLSSPGEQAEH